VPEYEVCGLNPVTGILMDTARKMLSAAVMIVALSLYPLQAQEATASLSGTVTDSSGKSRRERKSLG
jgi:hypothetical protein